MKNLIPLAILLATTLIGKISLSQESASEGKVEYQKGDKIAAVIEMPYSSDVVEDAIRDYMDKQGLKADHSKGFSIFHNAKPRIGDPEISDLHFKIEKRAAKKKMLPLFTCLLADREKIWLCVPAKTGIKLMRQKNTSIGWRLLLRPLI